MLDLLENAGENLRGTEICGGGQVLRFEGPKPVPPPVIFDASDELALALFKGDAGRESGFFVCSVFPVDAVALASVLPAEVPVSVLRIDSGGHIPKIYQSVVRAFVIDVINHRIRPSAVREEPCDTVRREEPVSYLYAPVSIRRAAIGSPAHVLSLRGEDANENPGLSIIGDRFTDYPVVVDHDADLIFGAEWNRVHCAPRPSLKPGMIQALPMELPK